MSITLLNLKHVSTLKFCTYLHISGRAHVHALFVVCDLIDRQTRGELVARAGHDGRRRHLATFLLRHTAAEHLGTISLYSTSKILID